MVALDGSNIHEDLPKAEGGSGAPRLQRNGLAQHGGSPDDTGSTGKALLTNVKNAEKLGDPIDLIPGRPGGIIRFLKKAKRSRTLKAGAGGFGILILGLIILLYIASAFKIPSLTQEILTWEFGRVARQTTWQLMKVANETLAVQTTATDADGCINVCLRDALKAQYPKEGHLWDAMQRLRMDRVADNLGIADDLDKLSIRYRPTKFGNKVLDSIVVRGETVKAPLQTGTLESFHDNFLDLTFPFKAWKSKFDFAKDLTAALKKTYAAEGVGRWGTWTRTMRIGKYFREYLDIDFKTWKAAEIVALAKKTPDQAELDVNRRFYNLTTKNGAEVLPVSSVEEINDTTQKARAATNEVVNDPSNAAELKDAIQNGGIVKRSALAVKAGLASNIWKTAVRTIGVATDIGVTGCIIYEGSIERAGPTINQTLQNEQRNFIGLAGTANELEVNGPQGSDNQGLMVINGATSKKLGATGHSDAYLHAAGLHVDTTTTTPSGESSPMLTYTLLDVLLGSSGVANGIKAVANQTCPVITRTDVGLAIAGINIVLILSSAGGAGVAEATADAAVETGVKKVTTNVAERVVGAIAERLTKEKIKSGLLRFGEWGFKNIGVPFVTITGITLIAHLIVWWQSASAFSGLEQGTEAANEATAGANAMANDHARLTGARPMTDKEILQSDQADAAQYASDMQKQSFSERYFALDNANSLLMRTANMVYMGYSAAATGKTFDLSAIMSLPKGLLNTALRPFIGTAGAESSSNENYGNVQFGFSNYEENLVDTDPSYLPLENQKILDDSKKADEIAKQYAACFGYRYDESGTSLDPTADNSKLKPDLDGYDDEGNGGSMGALLSFGKIVRDEQGNVIEDQGDCSPKNLGIKNPTYGDLVFRWRLTLGYYNTLDELTNLQTVTN